MILAVVALVGGGVYLVWTNFLRPAAEEAARGKPAELTDTSEFPSTPTVPRPANGTGSLTIFPREEGIASFRPLETSTAIKPILLESAEAQILNSREAEIARLEKEGDEILRIQQMEFAAFQAEQAAFEKELAKQSAEIKVLDIIADLERAKAESNISEPPSFPGLPALPLPPIPAPAPTPSPKAAPLLSAKELSLINAGVTDPASRLTTEDVLLLDSGIIQFLKGLVGLIQLSF